MDAVLYRNRDMIASGSSDDMHVANMQKAGLVPFESIQGFPGVNPEQLAGYSSWFGWSVAPKPEETPEKVAADLAAANPHFDMLWTRQHRRSREIMAMGVKNGCYYLVARWSPGKCVSEETIAAHPAKMKKRFVVTISVLGGIIIMLLGVIAVMVVSGQ